MQGGNILWSLAGFILIVSLLVPIISLYFFHEPIEVKPNFFIKTVIPAMLFASILSGTVYFNRKLSRMLILCLANLIIFAISYLIFKASLLQAFSYFAGSIIITGSIVRWVEKVKSKTLHTSSISMLLGHIGAGIFIIAVCFNNQFGYSKTINLSVQEKAEIKGEIQAYLVDIKYAPSKNYLRQVANIRILAKDNEITTLNPELRYYPVEKSLSSEVDIYSLIYNDWYSVINNIDGKRLSFQIFYHPGISFIWLSVFIVCFAIILRSIRK
jgi:cytochrome c-type biogenesis protein CcmF